MKYLLDTNIVSDIMHNPQGRVVSKITEVGDAEIFTSIIVVSEIRFGIEKRGSKKLAARLASILEVLPVETFEPPADEHYGMIRALTESLGLRVGDMDLLIAAQALSLGATVVTGNEREFSHVPNLKIENWLR
ncbi:type II toxin-antitoxin system VapC family toxin [Rhizobium sp. CG5]|uniref:type II toxin-antitoxin system VapC family toxin n=1 Tax=Rhizobium sp. CG5 TaxID=2726076 RepID=UPI0020344488|nr:type II toxin-antitoxin system VapC family toxin [Rhizobium sp. CG5]MCM2475939.1 type II toxin-antitoxin system VapC family toxin [Rhizobium sp. CG5]